MPGFGRQDPNDWGLGFEIRAAKHPHWTAPGNAPGTFGHFGRSGCFLWVDPVAGVALVVTDRRAFEAWAVEAWPAWARPCSTRRDRDWSGSPFSERAHRASLTGR